MSAAARNATSSNRVPKATAAPLASPNSKKWTSAPTTTAVSSEPRITSATVRHWPNGPPPPAAAAAEAAASARAAKISEAVEASFETTWGQVHVGQRVLGDAFGARFHDSPETVVNVVAAADGRLLVTTDRYGHRVAFRDPAEVVRVSTALPEPWETTDPLGEYVLLDDAPSASSSPTHGLAVVYGSGTKGHALAPMLAIISSARSGMISVFGCWYDAALAAEGLDVLAAAAARLATHTGVPLAPETAAAAVAVDEQEWITLDSTKRAEVRVGFDDWHDRYPGVVDVRHNRTSATVADPNVLAFAVARARDLLPRLTGHRA